MECLTLLLVISNVTTASHNNNRCRPRPPPPPTTGNTTKGIKALTRSIPFNGVNTMLQCSIFNIQCELFAGILIHFKLQRSFCGHRRLVAVAFSIIIVIDGKKNPFLILSAVVQWLAEFPSICQEY